MTEYRPPEEPPVGSRVRDVYGTVWERFEPGWANHPLPDERSPRLAQWERVLASSGPLTLIEPDPFPTAPYVWAEGRLWQLGEYGYLGIVESGSALWREESDPFTGPVVEVRPVPAAEWDALADTAHETGYPSAEYNLRIANAAWDAISATERMGADQ